MATLAKLLQVDMGLPDMAKRLAAAGRGKDSILAHINPKEAKLLKKHGGSGKINPATGIMEFEDGDSGFGGYDTTVDNEPSPTEVTQTQDIRSDLPPVTNLQAGQREAAVPLYDDRGNALDSSSTSASFQSPSGVPRTPIPKPPVAAQPTVEQANLPSSAPAAIPLDTSGYDTSGFNAEEPVKSEKSYGQRFKEFAAPYGQSAKAFGEALDPFAPYAKFGTQAFGLYQANKAANETREQAARNEAEIRALADPYRQQAALMQQQGQQILAAGQSGQLTPQQQQDLETRRAVALQQQAAAGVSGGTAAQQIEADIQRVAQQYAQQNISQGLALMSQAQTVAGTADTLVKQAIAAGYNGSQDANKLASEFYNAIGFSLPQTSSKGPTNA